LPARILVISTNREISPQPVVPIGAAWVAEALSLAGFEVELLDLCFCQDPLVAIGRALRTFDPQGIGVSVRNLDTCDFLSPHSFLPEVKTITDFLKVHSAAPILLGGSAVSVMPSQILEYLDLEYAVVGEGERAAVAFFSGLLRAGDLAAMPGLVRRRKRMGAGANVEFGAAGGAPPSLPAAVTPVTHKWVDTRRYLGLEPVLPVQGKRGCANRCLYCTYPGIEGREWRMREPGAVAEEIAAAMRDTGARRFEFVDSIFNQPEGYLELLLEELLKSGVKAWLSAASLSPKGLSREQLLLMERAGMESMVITPETVSDPTLQALRKGFSEAEVMHAAELVAGSRIKALWCFLAGGPGEDRSSLERTARFLSRKVAGKDAAFITTGIRIYPGTDLQHLAIEEGVVEAGDDLLMPRFYFSQKVAPQEAIAILRNGAGSCRCIFPSDARSNYLRPLRRIGTMLGLPTPFWRYSGVLSRLSGARRMVRRFEDAGPAGKI